MYGAQNGILAFLISLYLAMNSSVSYNQNIVISFFKSMKLKITVANGQNHAQPFHTGSIISHHDRDLIRALIQYKDDILPV